MGALRMYSHRGGIGGSLMKLGSRALPVLRGLPGVGTIATIVGAGASAYGAVQAGRSAAKAITLPGPGGRTIRPLAALPGGVPFITRKKYRRINPMNFKALKRAVRRLDAAEKAFRSVLRVRTPEQAKRSIVPKTKRRK